MTHLPDPPALHSEYADDQEMVELIELFVSEMPDRIRELRGAFGRGAWDDVRRIAHQLKGAAPSYGFGPIGEAASSVESLVSRDIPLDDIAEAVDELLSLCGRASSTDRC